MTQNIYLSETFVGNGLLSNVVVHPYMNGTFPLTGTININAAIRNLTQILAAEREPLSRNKLAVTTSGNTTFYNGVQLPYFEFGLNQLRATADVNVSEVLNGINLAGSGRNPSATSTTATSSPTATPVNVGGLPGLSVGTGNGGSGGLSGILPGLDSILGGIFRS